MDLRAEPGSLSLSMGPPCAPGLWHAVVTHGCPEFKSRTYHRPALTSPARRPRCLSLSTCK